MERSDQLTQNWGERLSREARDNVEFALWQALGGLVVIIVLMFLDHPLVLQQLQNLAQRGLIAPDLSWVWLAKWMFILGAGVHVFVALFLLLLSVRHMREARLLRVQEEC
jgi:hypothetical protein